MTWGELELACHGYEIRLARSRELERYIATVLRNNNSRSSAISPLEFLPLITDKEVYKKRASEVMTKEEFEEIQKDVSKRYGREEINS